MAKRLLALGLVAYALWGVIAYGQNGDTEPPATASKGLKDVYAGRFLMGTAGDVPGRYSEAELANIKAHYDIVTPENVMKPQGTHPAEDTYNFSTTDALVDWCEQNGLKVWGHTLCWHSQTPNWFFQAPASEAGTQGPTQPASAEGTPAEAGPPQADRARRAGRGGFGGFGRGARSGPPASREVAMERLKDHIMTVVGRYKGRLLGWDVVNEAIADGGDGSTENLRNFSWYTTIGPDVLTMAFKWAHEADPDAELYYNDYNIEQGAVENTGKHASSLLLLKRLIAEGAPITGVGIQGHWHLDTNLADVEKAIENYAALGLKVSITELDVTSTGGNSGAFGVRRGSGTISPEASGQQAEVFRKLFEIFNRHADAIERVTFWGISDTRSWRRGQGALIFDGQMQPKPAYRAIMDVGLAKDDTPTLKDVYQDHFYIGAAINRLIATGQVVRANNANRTPEELRGDTALVKAQYNQIVNENDLKPSLIHPNPGPDGYNWAPADAFVQFGLDNNMYIVGHTLVWHSQVPNWFFEGTATETPDTATAQTPATPATGERGGRGGFRRRGGITGPLATREQLLERMRDHIHAVVGRYKGKVKVWDVVNEALADGGDEVLRSSYWTQIIGPDFIAKAFQYAHEADPDAILRYNDYGLEHPAKRERLKKLIKDLQDQNIPVHAIGTQTHINVSTTFETMDETLADLASIGLPVHITELDVNAAVRGQRNTSGDVATSTQRTEGGVVSEADQRQTKAYEDLFRAIMKHKDSIDVVTFWGANDAVSWLGRGRPLLFDGNNQPKPAFDAVIGVATKE